MHRWFPPWTTLILRSRGVKLDWAPHIPSVGVAHALVRQLKNQVTGTAVHTPWCVCGRFEISAAWDSGVCHLVFQPQLFCGCGYWLLWAFCCNHSILREWKPDGPPPTRIPIPPLPPSLL